MEIDAKQPLVSVFTPSHDTTYLTDAYESLASQSYENWEWLVLLNGAAAEQRGSATAWTCLDPRVTIRYAPGTHGVGKLKRWACKPAQGEYLLELDHDDILAPRALERVVWAFESAPADTTLVFSDFAQIKEDGGRDESRFAAAMGWTYSEDNSTGFPVLRCHTMAAFPSSVSYIWFAPNHLRAFRTSAYDAVGGYSSSLEVLDDLDLMARLYQHGGFFHIDECLYLQRVHPGNTQVRPDLNQQIQAGTVEMYDQHVQANALAWAKRHDLLALDLGSAHRKPDGYLGLDQYEGPGVDIVGDITEGIPLPDNSVGVIRAVDFLEHVFDKVGLMNECYRVLAHGGMLLSMTPSTDGRGAFQDPTHVAYWNENSFWYYTDSNYAAFVPEVKCRFQVSRMVTNYPTAWHEEHRIAYVCANLVAVKDGPRIAGELKI
jgi:glycosyltransferase involved in cell wall biosynthesis